MTEMSTVARATRLAKRTHFSTLFICRPVRRARPTTRKRAVGASLQFLRELQANDPATRALPFFLRQRLFYSKSRQLEMTANFPPAEFVINKWQSPAALPRSRSILRRRLAL